MIIYGDAELKYISSKDNVMRYLVNKYGYLEKGQVSDVFASLVLHIISQLLSKNAAKRISDRFVKLVEEITPENVLKKSVDEIKKCGMSQRKAEYIYELSYGVYVGKYNFDSLNEMTDEQVIEYLMTIKGVGYWTAEMVAEFTLGRLNVFSYRDVALKNGIIKAHGFKTLSEVRFERLKKKYSPYASVASLYYYAINDDKLNSNE